MTTSTRAVGVALAVDFVIGIAKTVAFFLTGSTAVMAEVLHSAADITNCFKKATTVRLRETDPQFHQNLATKGVRYTNSMPGSDDAGSGQGRSWRSTLSVDTRERAESRLAELGYEWDWLDGDVLRATTPVLPAIRALEDGRETFFNQLIAAYRGWSDSRNDPNRAIMLGNGEPIPAEAMAEVIAIADELTADIAWQAGDVALIDNYTVMHGRRPFVGKRRVLASLIS